MSIYSEVGVGCHSLLQASFPTHRLNPCLLHCRQIHYHLNHQRSPIKGNRILSSGGRGIYTSALEEGTSFSRKLSLEILKSERPELSQDTRSWPGLFLAEWSWVSHLPLWAYFLLQNIMIGLHFYGSFQLWRKQNTSVIPWTEGKRETRLKC